MLRRILAVSGVAVGLLAIIATSAVAHELTVTVTATCACEYTVTASGNTDANAVVIIDYKFTETSNGVDYPVTGQINTNADSNGNFSATKPGTLPGACANATVSFSLGSANLTFNNTTETGFHVDLPSTLTCGPPSGKTFDIGPSSMEGHLLIRPARPSRSAARSRYPLDAVTEAQDSSSSTWAPTTTMSRRTIRTGSPRVTRTVSCPGQVPVRHRLPAAPETSWTTARGRFSRRLFHRIPTRGRC